MFLLPKAWPVLHRPRVHRVLGRATGVVLTGFGPAVAGTTPLTRWPYETGGVVAVPGRRRGGRTRPAGTAAVRDR
ncbi:hypothetical protein ACFYN9_31655 [Streptomyces collinus]|uniref:Uncharacterized protein n=1 Tax=Streptomyces collinus TaxID=42684 RepID=A0AA89QSI9_STRCU|nr:hypothetical protein [Streptomyces collinus]MBB5816649.1 hypothetical protein [Streptomyces collinus]WMX62084.1 hypothetical protein RFN52_01395 [Streptomyces collinus]